MRSFYLALGYTSLALGILGIALPVLPTTPFIILAAWAFTRSNPALAAWLYNHPRFGTILTTWRDQGAIPFRVKIYALFVMAVSYAVTIWLTSNPYVPFLLAVILGSVGLYIATRPSPRE
ncbi:YbaN family protein [Microvirga sp. ACRRW]|uniref:YbaN family protein n=1 Tax=Microvirga sp. ACRRW TaxID=2918205 RepID=UPI001EF4BFE8|nr:YbaN family protein [Microvirga sp. ACRRW]MCG7393754.1 YbaN family protein [Microvirga sp. ACRRW]